MQKYLERIEEIIEMKKEWSLDKEEGVPAPTDKSLNEAKRVLPLMLEYEKNHNFYIYPSMTGGVLIEWSPNEWEVSVEILSDGKSYELIAVNTQGSGYVYNKQVNISNSFQSHFQEFLSRFK